MNLFTHIKELLSKNEKFCKDNELFKNNVVEAALKVDTELIKLLLTDDKAKETFFNDIEGVMVFDKVKFQKFVSNKQFLPDSYTAFKNKIGLTANGEFLTDAKEVVLDFPYKDCVLEGGQTKEDQKRKEIFWNETLAPDDIDRLFVPKVFTNWKKYDKDGEHEVTDISLEDNLIIKGNNLIALHSLKEVYRGKIKLIYIDPPYNTGGNGDTFEYNNTFKRSTWLTFMKNRLEAAKELLTDDGAIIVAIDENEQVHLGVLLKEMFINHETHCITIIHNPRGIQGTNFSYTNEFAFFIIPKGKKTIINRIKSDDEISWSNLRNWGGESLRSDAKNCFYPIIVNKTSNEIEGFGEVCNDTFHPEKRAVEKDGKLLIYPVDNDGIERKWRYSNDSVHNIKTMLRARLKSGQMDIEIGKNFEQYRTVWSSPKYDSNEYGTKILKELIPNCNFSFPKSLWNVYDCINAVVGNDKNCIVLDYHAGSGTTAHALLEINLKDKGNRKFIMCEQMDYVKTVTKERIQAVIKNNKEKSFIYTEIANSKDKYISSINKSKDSNQLLEIWEKLKKDECISHKVSPTKIDKEVKDFKNLDLEQQKQFLLYITDSNQLYVNYSDIEDKNHTVTDTDKKITTKFYNL